MLFLLGRGRYEDAIRRQIQRLGLSSVVTLAHPRGDVTGALRNADIFVLPAETPLIAGLKRLCRGLSAARASSLVPQFSWFIYQYTPAGRIY